MTVFFLPGLEGYLHLFGPAVWCGGDGRCATGLDKDPVGSNNFQLQRFEPKGVGLSADGDFHPRPKLVKSNPHIVRDARCESVSRNSEEVPKFDR